MRKTLSVTCATGLLLGCSYALYVLALDDHLFKIRIWMFAAAGMGLVLAGYWLWEDFVRPPRDKSKP